MPTRPTLAERFWVKVNPCGPVHPTLGSCWLWTACVTPGGYGQLRANRTSLYAHRLAYELTTGPIPHGRELDHLCRVRHCVNPAHLDPVTHAENLRRGDTWQHNIRKTHCPKGHPYAGENLRIHRGKRECRECHNAWMRESRAAMKGRV